MSGGRAAFATDVSYPDIEETVQDNDDRGVNDPMEDIDYLSIHSTAEDNAQS
jgi:hypothetical protein